MTEECLGGSRRSSDGSPQEWRAISGAVSLLLIYQKTFPVVTGDSFLLEQMMMQVVDNAWKYSQTGRAPLRISGLVEGASVDPDGLERRAIEIPVDERERIFDKFYRGSKDRHRVEGTGLGLAIARMIGPRPLKEESGSKLGRWGRHSGSKFPLEARGGVTGRATGRVRDRKQHYITG